MDGDIDVYRRPGMVGLFHHGRDGEQGFWVTGEAWERFLMRAACYELERRKLPPAPPDVVPVVPVLSEQHH
jgi:hypothetical protein